MKNRQAISLLIVSLFTLNFTHAQSNDFGVWNKLGVNKDLPKGFDLSWTGQFRLNENALRTDALISDFTIKYKFEDWLKFAATYRLGAKNQLESTYFLRHRVALDAVLSYPNDTRFKYAYRLRFQSQDPNILSNENSNYYDQTIRHKLILGAKINKKWDVGMGFELFTQGTSVYDLNITDWRWKVELERDLPKRKTVSVGYMIQSELLSDDPVTDYVILIGFDYDLKKKKKKKKKKSETPASTQ